MSAKAQSLTEAWTAGSGYEMLRQLRHEQAGFVRRWRRRNDLVQAMTECAFTRNIVWRNGWHVGARLCPEPNASSARVEIEFGTLLAIDDLMCTAASGAGFMQHFSDVEDPHPLPLLFDRDLARRFDSYDLNSIPASGPSSLIGAVPLSEARLKLAAFMARQAMDWVQLHEQAHLMLGHLDFIGERTPRLRGLALEECTIALNAESVRTDIDIRRVFEFQADAHALELLFTQNLWPNTPAAFAGKSNAALGLRPGTVNGPNVAIADFGRAARILVVSASLVALLFERRTERIGTAIKTYHPHASSRLMNILITGASLTEEFFEEILRRNNLPPLTRHQMDALTIRLLIEASADLFIAGLIIGIQDRSLVYDETSDDPLDTAFLRDLFTLLNSGDGPRGTARRPATDGGKEFKRLYRLNGDVFAALERFHRGGWLLKDRVPFGSTTRRRRVSASAISG
jgi:hypothetical protein